MQRILTYAAYADVCSVAYASTREEARAYARMRACVQRVPYADCIRQHTSAYTRMREAYTLTARGGEKS
jgi:hypothetical protein